MSATIHKISGFDSSPALLLEMLKSNGDEMESVVISVITDDGQATYASTMKSSDLTYHLYGIQADVLADLAEREE